MATRRPRRVKPKRGRPAKGFVRLELKVPPDVKASLVAEAKASKTTISDVVVLALKQRSMIVMVREKNA
jgi:hypothetical protein